ncbi:hypothetical protein HMPREF1486_02824 [Streptomyces sp. HPH0547]|nr:hypothetical protein HMPREF1486_02824 [Streptomyces sp. HPH0547]
MAEKDGGSHLCEGVRCFVRCDGERLVAVRLFASGTAEPGGKCAGRSGPAVRERPVARVPRVSRKGVGAVFGAAGAPGACQESGECGVDEVPETARRDRGVYLARRATAAAVAREPDRAVELAGEAARIVVDTGSVRMRRELEALQYVMRPWQEAPIGRRLAEVLATVDERGRRG